MLVSVFRTHFEIMENLSSSGGAPRYLRAVIFHDVEGFHGVTQLQGTVHVECGAQGAPGGVGWARQPGRL